MLETGLVKLDDKLVKIEATIIRTKSDVSKPLSTAQAAPTTNPPPTPTSTNTPSQSSQILINSPLESSEDAPSEDPLEGFVFSASSPANNLNWYLLTTQMPHLEHPCYPRRASPACPGMLKISPGTNSPSGIFLISTRQILSSWANPRCINVICNPPWSILEVSIPTHYVLMTSLIQNFL